MIESSHCTHSNSNIQQHMCSKDVILREFERISKAQIYMRLRRKVENRIYVELSEASQDIGRAGYITVEEGEIDAALQDAGVVSRAAVIQLIKRNDIICAWILGDKVTDEPASTAYLSRIARSTVCCYTHMKPSPPVTKMFRTSGSGSNDSWPVKSGASRQRPSSSKNLDSRLDWSVIEISSYRQQRRCSYTDHWYPKAQTLLPCFATLSVTRQDHCESSSWSKEEELRLQGRQMPKCGMLARVHASSWKRDFQLST